MGLVVMKLVERLKNFQNLDAGASDHQSFEACCSVKMIKYSMVGEVPNRVYMILFLRRSSEGG
jgi:hypothetical protein